MSWYKNTGDIVISTRIRLARNIKNLPFPHKMNESQIETLCQDVKNIFINKKFSFGKLNYISLENAGNELESMVERHIISPNFAANAKNRALLISDDESVSIMLCEEDHIRIQVIKGTNTLKESYKIAKEIDKVINENLDIAYSENLGFLTACPTNLGTGLRASLMLHLPAIEMHGGISSLVQSVSKIGFTVRGLYGEGSKAFGSLYQISNQVTLGLLEEDAVKNLDGIVEQIINQEKTARKDFSKEKLEDMVFRALGTLKSARIMSSSEMGNLISLIKLGISEGIIKDIEKNLPMRLFIETAPNMIQKSNGRMTPLDRDCLRAKILREELKKGDLL